MNRKVDSTAFTEQSCTFKSALEVRFTRQDCKHLGGLSFGVPERTLQSLIKQSINYLIFLMKLGKLCPDRHVHTAFSLEIWKLRHAFSIIYVIYFSLGYSSGVALTQ